MTRMPLTAVDLNLLKALYAIADKGQITAAADAVGLSQPAMSHALKRLRALAKEDLFIRTAQGMVPTPYCTKILPTVARIMADCTTVFDPDAAFAPEEAELVFRIGMNDYYSIVQAPRLVAALGLRAPLCRLEVVNLPRGYASGRNFRGDLAHDYLDDGLIDVAIMKAEAFPPRFRSRKLFSDRFAVIMSSKHPLASQPLTMEAFCEISHVKVTTAPMRSGWLDEWFATNAMHRRIAVKVPQFAAAAAVVSQSELIATVPKGFADAVASHFGLVVHDLPMPTNDHAAALLWLGSRDAEASLAWFRKLVTETIALPE